MGIEVTGLPEEVINAVNEYKGNNEVFIVSEEFREKLLDCYSPKGDIRRKYNESD